MAEHIAVLTRQEAPLDPIHPAWGEARPTKVTLLPQQMTRPNGGGAADEVDVRFLTSRRHMALRLQWGDTSNEDAVGLRRFRDGCAVMFPAVPGKELPSPIMGSDGNPVVIWQWKPDWEDTEQQSAFRAQQYPQYGDTYNPHNEWLWRDFGDRPVDGEHANIVVAEGFGTVTRTHDPDLQIQSHSDGGRRSVVFQHPIPTQYPQIAPGVASALNVAVWNGADDDVGCRKSISLTWQPFEVPADLKAVAQAGMQLANVPVVASSLTAAGVAWVIRRRMALAKGASESEPGA